MQLTFGNMTMDVNIFYLVKKPYSLDEGSLEEVFAINDVVGEHMDGLMA